jgi:hypothetical protein
VQCSAVQCSAVQCSAVQCSAVQCSAVQCSAVQCSAVQCSAVQCSAGGVNSPTQTVSRPICFANSGKKRGKSTKFSTAIHCSGAILGEYLLSTVTLRKRHICRETLKRQFCIYPRCTSCFGQCMSAKLVAVAHLIR